MYKITIIDTSTLSNDLYTTSLQKETIKLSSISNESNLIFRTNNDISNHQSNFAKKSIFPEGTVIQSKSKELNKEFDNENGTLIIDVKNDTVQNVDCTSSKWQTQSTKVNKFIFHDLDKETTSINNIIIEGSSDHIIGIKDILKPTDNIHQINKLIHIFKENNDNLLTKLLSNDEESDHEEN